MDTRIQPLLAVANQRKSISSIETLSCHTSLLTGHRLLRQVSDGLVPPQCRQHAQVLQHGRRGEVKRVEDVREVLDVCFQVLRSSLAQSRQ